MNSSKKYGAARGHNFHSCANKETTDYYSQSRGASKNPRATIRTAALPIRIHVSLIRTAALRIAASFVFLRKTTTTKSLPEDSNKYSGHECVPHGVLQQQSKTKKG